MINYLGTQRGGAERIAWDLHRGLPDIGIECSTLSLERCDADAADNVISLGKASPYDPRIPAILHRRHQQAFREADVVHAHLFPSSLYVALLRRFGAINAPCLFTEHNTDNRRRGNVAGQWLDGFTYAGFDAIAAISDGVRRGLCEYMPGLSDRSTVVMNGCELRYSAPKVRSPKPEPVILSVGRLTRQKNYDQALEALARLKDKPFRYVVLGEGRDRDDLEAQAVALGLAERVEFAGWANDISPYLDSADIFLMPSRWEGFGLAAVEAMNASLPVVASDVAGLREVVGEEGLCAHLVPPDDITAISGALSGLLSDPAERMRLGVNGFERSCRFDVSVMIERYSGVYRALASGGGYRE